ncbi:alpha-hydroxy-acid oxidizing protein [Streptomyces sp. NPDC008092]|uniref:alpha-hydroxy acid oxidase n=1 Tax=Streptomyces sp. NPDC008092 TaxID=3364808 RepID=UPI0036EF1506
MGSGPEPGVVPHGGAPEAEAAGARCLADVERAAGAVLPVQVRDFVAGGSGTEATLDANRAAFERVFLVPRVLGDVSGCSTGATFFGRPASMPVAVAPVAYQRLLHPDGELAVARAAKAAGVPFAVSTLSSVPVEELAAVGGDLWFQLYWLQDAQRALELVRRAEDAGCAAIVLTVDVPWMGRRLRDLRNRFTLPPHVTAAHLTDAEAGGAAGHPSGPAHPGGPADTRAHGGTAAHRPPADGVSAVAVHTRQTFSPAVTWSTVELLRGRTRLPLVLKGVLAPEDAVRAAESGVDAVVVSNHGGRQLDAAVPSLDALGPVTRAVAGRCRVLLDSGVRSGTDVLRALALGADGVLVGRPVMWGLAAAGEDGAARVLALLADELRDALGLAGCPTVADAARLRTLRVPARR